MRYTSIKALLFKITKSNKYHGIFNLWDIRLINSLKQSQ